MEERKNPEGNAGARERQKKDKRTGIEENTREMRRANIAGESYVPPGKASPAYAPDSEIAEASGQQGTGKATGGEEKARMMRRANLAGERYETPAKKGELHKPGSKTVEVSERRGAAK